MDEDDFGVGFFPGQDGETAGTRVALFSTLVIAEELVAEGAVVENCFDVPFLFAQNGESVSSMVLSTATLVVSEAHVWKFDPEELVEGSVTDASLVCWSFRWCSLS